MVEGFLVRTITQVMPESCIELLVMGFCIGIDLPGCGFQSVQMSLRIAITKGMIRDDRKAGFQEVLKFGVHLPGNFKF